MKYIFPLFLNSAYFWSGSLVLLFLISILFISYLVVLYKRFRLPLNLTTLEIFNAAILLMLHQFAFTCLICGLFKAINARNFIIINFTITLIIAFLSKSKFEDIKESLSVQFRSIRLFFNEILKDAHSSLLLISIIIFSLTIAAFLLILPPDSFDTFYYHLPMAALMMQEGNLGPFQFHYGIVNQYPKTAEFFFLIPMLLTHSDIWTRLVQLIFLLLSIPIVYCFLRNYNLTRTKSFIFSGISFFFITPITQAYKDWGYIDNILTTTFLLSLVLLSPKKSSPRAVFGRIAVSILPAILCFSMKGNGILHLFTFSIIAILYIIACNVWKSKLWFVILLLGVFLIPLWSYQYIQNYKIYHNPLYPIEIKIKDRVIFKGECSPKQIMSVQTPQEIEGKNTYQALSKSWSTLFVNGHFGLWGRMGGWGLLWLLGVLPLSIAASIFFILRRDYNLLRILLPLLFLFWFMPSNWWARYVAFIFGIGSILSGIFIEKFKIPALKLSIISYLIILSLMTGTEAIFTHINNESPIEYIEKVRDTYKIEEPIASVDTYSKWANTCPERDIYKWFVYNLPRKSTVYYRWDQRNIFAYFFFRPDFNNKIYYLPSSSTEEDFLKILGNKKRTFITVTDNVMEYQWLSKHPEFFIPIYSSQSIKIFKKIFSN